MSYEGYTQVLCKNGHYREFDCHISPELNDEFTLCSCGEPYVWSNEVDQTNGGNQGIIPIEKMTIKTLAVTETCSHCNHTKVVKEVEYLIPDNKLREYKPDEDCW